MLLRINIIFLFLFSLFSIIYPKGSQNFVTASNIIGRCEVKRGGSNKWDILRVGNNVFTNDIIRVSDGSRATIKWPGGNEIILKSNSQLQIDISSDSNSHIILNHATLFWGAVYFVINKTFTKSNNKYSTKIFTPTSVVGIRGTSFSVSVEKGSGTSATKVINGSVTVKNIYSGKSIYLDAIRKSVVIKGNGDFKVALLTDIDIDSMKSDYGSKIIEQEMSKQIKYTRSISNAINNRPDDRLVISIYSDFKNGDWNVGSVFERELLDQLRNRYKLNVVKFPGRNSIDSTEQLGADSLKCNYIAEVSIVGVSVDKVAGISASADKYSEQSVASICVHIIVKDVINGKVVYDRDICDKSTGKNNSDNSWETISKLKFDPSDKYFLRSLLGKTFNLSMVSIIEALSESIKKNRD